MTSTVGRDQESGGNCPLGDGREPPRTKDSNPVATSKRSWDKRQDSWETGLLTSCPDQHDAGEDQRR